MKSKVLRRTAASVLTLACVLVLGSVVANAQGRGVGGWGEEIGRLGGRMVELKVGDITLEAIDFRDQTARLNVGLDVKNGLLPVSLKDFDYNLRLFDRQFIEGRHEGALKVGGRRSSRIELPVVVHLREIPGMVWSAFKNRGQVRYEMDAGFTLPLFITERRFDQNFSGEVPLRTLVDAASILRAERMSGGAGGGIINDVIRDRVRVGGWPF